MNVLVIRCGFVTLNLLMNEWMRMIVSEKSYLLRNGLKKVFVSVILYLFETLWSFVFDLPNLLEKSWPFVTQSLFATRYSLRNELRIVIPFEKPSLFVFDLWSTRKMASVFAMQILSASV